LMGSDSFCSFSNADTSITKSNVQFCSTLLIKHRGDFLVMILVASSFKLKAVYSQ
jgi:hypothetical protein